jgi:hypothetical protein
VNPYGYHGRSAPSIKFPDEQSYNTDRCEFVELIDRLLLLLATLPGPLIVDQPEDDLDNRFISEGVVPRVRALKGKRQLVFSTHNANIPVLGDAELMVVLESAKDKGRIAEGGVGSLDDKTVLTLAGEILEGGSDAFRRRRYLYGF